MSIIKVIFAGGLIALLNACAMSGTDNSPAPMQLTSIKQSINVQKQWQETLSVSQNNELTLSPYVTPYVMLVDTEEGQVDALQTVSGKKLWSMNVKQSISAPAAMGDGKAVVATAKGNLYVFNTRTGKMLWDKQLPTQVLSRPVIGENRIVVKSLDGTVTCFNASNGRVLWDFSSEQPDLILRSSSAPVIHEGKVTVGFANGKLYQFELSTGKILWQRQLAMPSGAQAIQRMVDVDSTPLIDEQALYVVTYQGNLLSLDVKTGDVNWQRKFSSFRNIALTSKNVVAVDTQDIVAAFDKSTGASVWQQKNLKARHLTAPIANQHYIAIADKFGYVHWLSQDSGKFIGRVQASFSPIWAQPKLNKSQTIVYSSAGELISYKVGRS